MVLYSLFDQKSWCYIIKERFFYFNHFSLIIFYHSVWLGFELFRLRVQVCSQLVQFTLARKEYGNHHCHNKSQTQNGAGLWMTLCPEEMGWEFGRFWKRFSWVPTMGWRSWVQPWCWEVEVRQWCWEVGVWPWCWKRFSWVPIMMLRSWVWPWCWEAEVRPWSWRLTLDYAANSCNWGIENEFSNVVAAVKFFGSLPILNTTRCAERLWCGVSIVWYERLLRIVSLSPCVEELKSEVNKTFVPEQWSCLCIWVLLVYICSIQH